MSSQGDVLDFVSLSLKDVVASLQPPVAAEATFICGVMLCETLRRHMSLLLRQP